jgi:predicted TPR repeat methyltransferase
LESKISASFFDEDYFINGKKLGKSLYENYRWLPDLTIPMAESLITYLGISAGSRVLDYGCANGFLVKALRNLGVQSFGCDISKFAIENCDLEIKPYLTLIKEDTKFPFLPDNFHQKFDYIIAKDVFEHIPKTGLKRLLTSMLKMTDRLYVLVPLGDEGVYRIADYELDQSHVIAEDEHWWEALFYECGFKKVDFALEAPGIKEAALALHTRGNGHFRIYK